MSLRWLAQQCAPLLQVLTRTPLSGAARGVAPFRLHSTSAGAEQQVFGGQTLLEIRHRIFGDSFGNNLPSGRKVLRKKLVGEKVASYYGLDQKLEREDPFFVDLTAEGCVACVGACILMAKPMAVWRARQQMLPSCAGSRTSAAVCVAVQEEGEAGQAEAAWQGAAEEGRGQAYQAQVRRPLHQAAGAQCSLKFVETGVAASAAKERSCWGGSALGFQLGVQHAAWSVGQTRRVAKCGLFGCWDGHCGLQMRSMQHGVSDGMSCRHYGQH